MGARRTMMWPALASGAVRWHNRRMGSLILFVLIVAAVAYGFSALRKSTPASPEDEAKAIAQADARLSEIDREMP